MLSQIRDKPPRVLRADQSRQAYPPANGRPGGRWSSACTSSTDGVPGWSSGKT